MIPVRLILENTYNAAAVSKSSYIKKTSIKIWTFAMPTVPESNSVPVDTVPYIPYGKDQDLTIFSLLRIFNQTGYNQLSQVKTLHFYN